MLLMNLQGVSVPKRSILKLNPEESGFEDPDIRGWHIQKYIFEARWFSIHEGDMPENPRVPTKKNKKVTFS